MWGYFSIKYRKLAMKLSTPSSFSGSNAPELLELIMIEEHCLLGYFHGGINYGCVLGF
jgi:hypothetical protein